MSFFIHLLVLGLVFGLVYYYFNERDKQYQSTNTLRKNPLSRKTELQPKKAFVDRMTQTDVDRRRHATVVETAVVNAMFTEAVEKLSHLSQNNAGDRRGISDVGSTVERQSKASKVVETNVPYLGSVKYHQGNRPLELYVVLDDDFIPRTIAKCYLQSQQRLIWDRSAIKIERHVSDAHESPMFDPSAPIYTIWILHTDEGNSDDAIPGWYKSHGYTRTIDEILRARFLSSIEEIFDHSGRWVTIKTKKLVGRPAMEKLAELGNQTC
ncbi:hypothetical protein NEOLI_004123 [Neolecta irregularis DAH-3]|uniref:Uncharacterized protein n=1 Tax=Neolecta irregularis (strain DAH-3) TaxID=1198029 RepID=A0A1U7LQF2_NEOID|nr:hypothetical protein NEOLI_004123 [Neolecta irregularis DAH-3]|eukprot:OLL24874.1 hypothetical protein NEOLI_004123 [Neolecta irregularis DAH-3]